MNKRQLTPRLNRLEPNIVIDGNHNLWPQGTSVSVPNGSDVYGSVLFKNGNANTGVTLTSAQSSSVPSGTSLQFSSRLSKTASGSVAAGTYSNQSYFIEGYDIDSLINKEFSVIFWVKSSVATNRSFSIRNASNTHSYVQQYNIAAANTWELKVLKFDALSTCPGTINRTNGVGLNLNWAIVIGSTYQTATLNQWVSGNFVAGLGEDTTWLTGTTHDFSIAGVMVLPGDWRSLQTNMSAYTFVRNGRNAQQEETATKRYWETGGQSVPDVGNASGVLGGLGQVHYRVEKRATPTLTITGNGSPNQVRNDNSGATEGTVTVGSSGVLSHGARSTSALSDNIQYSYAWTADSRF